MKNSKTNKKSVPKKRKVTNKKRSNKKNTFNKTLIPIIIVCIVLVIILCILLLKTKKVECAKTNNRDGIKETINVLFELKNDKIVNLTNKKELVFNKENINYVSAVKNALEENYKNKDINYNISSSKNKINIDFSYNKNKKYILDDMSLSSSDDGISINIVSEDKMQEYATFNLGKNYSEKNIKAIMKKANFTCK